MLFPLYVKGPDTCRKRGNLNFDWVVFKVSFDVDRMRTLKVILTAFRKFFFIWGGFS